VMTCPSPEQAVIYLQMVTDRFDELQEDDYTLPKHTYGILNQYEVTTDALDAFLREWDMFFDLDEQKQGAERFKLRKLAWLHRFQKTDQSYLLQGVVPAIAAVVDASFEQPEPELENYLLLLPDLFYSSYRWLIIQRVRSFVHGLTKYHAGKIRPVVPAVSNKFLSFEYLPTDDQPLVKLFTNLNRRIDFIDKSKTSLSIFIAILTDGDPSTVEGGICFNCETVQVTYILRRIRMLFGQLTFQHIGASGKFFTRNGIALTANNLSRNKNTTPKDQDIIGKVLKEIL
jgi:hypothetical protein